MRACTAVASLVTASLLMGCTELVVKKAEPGLVEGIPYNLPKKTFLIVVSYELRGCIDKKPQPQLEVAKTVTVTAANEVDESERYYVPYSSLRNWFKNTNLQVEAYDNQTVKALTSTITDKTGEIITAAIGTVTKIASLGAGAPMKSVPATAPAPPPPPAPACNTDALAALKDLKEARAKASPTPDDTARIAELRAKLTHRESVAWSPRKPSQTQVDPVFDIRVYPGDLVGPAGKWVKAYGELEPMGALASYVQLAVRGKVSVDPASPPSGFLMRQGAVATLRICDEACLPPRADPVIGSVIVDETNVLASAVHVIPQLGDYVAIPLKNRIFEDQTLTMTMSADGAITKLGLTSNAAALAGLNNLNASLDVLAKARETRDKAAATAAAAAQTATKDHADQVAKENNAIADCLKAQKTLIEAGGRPSGTCQ